jgi:precorrin-2 dehydrogenase/sirohydrochlorin ferrochelatase
MNGLFPIILQLKGRRCIVVGGGAVAERKAGSLLAAGADKLIVISPTATPELMRQAEAGALRWQQRSFADEDLEGAFLVFAATNNRAVNERIARECERLAILASVADEAEEGSFISPSVIRRGDLLLAVTASGASPALSRLIGGQLAERYGPEYEEIASCLRRLREHATAAVADDKARREILKLAAEEAVSADIRNNDPDEWLQRLLHRRTGGHKGWERT